MSFAAAQYDETNPTVCVNGVTPICQSHTNPSFRNFSFQSAVTTSNISFNLSWLLRNQEDKSFSKKKTSKKQTKEKTK